MQHRIAQFVRQIDVRTVRKEIADAFALCSPHRLNESGVSYAVLSIYVRPMVQEQQHYLRLF